MLFPIFIFKDKASDYGVTVPGLPGCFSAGRTIEEAMENAREAIELHLEGMAEDGEQIPEQGSVDDYSEQIKAGGIAALVEVDTSAYEAKQSERVNVTFPKQLLVKIDRASERLGMTRSGLLQKAARKYITETGAVKEGARTVRSVREPRGPMKKGGKMKKIQLGPSTIAYPMPAFLIGADVDGRPNFMVAAWSGIACSDPPMITVAFQPHRHTLKGVKANRAFSVNVPPVSLMKETDFCGMFSGKDEDKSGVFEVFYGKTEHAPLISECPVNLECKVVMTLQLGSHDLVVAEIKEVHISEDALGEDGRPDPAKVDPLIFTVPDRTYRRLGEVVGKAFKAGKELKK